MGNTVVVGAESYLFDLVAASDEILLSADTEKFQSTTIYVKVKEVKITRSGTYRIKFDLRVNLVGADAYGRVRKNGVAFGTERITGLTSYTTYTEDLIFSAEDLVQLYFKNDIGRTVYTRNFRVCGKIPLKADPTLLDLGTVQMD